MSSRDTYPNHTYNFSLHLSFTSILRHSVISKCLLYVPVTSIPTLTDNNVELQFAGLTDHHVSYATTGNYQQYSCLIFDITSWVISNYPLGSFDFNIGSDIPISFYDTTGNTSFVIFTRRSLFASYDLSHSEISEHKIGASFIYKQDIESSFYTIEKRLFNDEYKLNYSLIFSSHAYYNESSSYLFFPKGWRLNILESISISTNIITYTDANLHKAKYKNSLVKNNDTNKDIYLDENGSGSIIKKENNNNVITYKMYSPIKQNEYKLFDSTGRITLIHLANNLTVTFTYTTNSISIIDAVNGISISVTKSSNSIIIRDTNVGSGSYNHEFVLNVNNSNNTLTNIENIVDVYSNNAFTTQTKLDSFTYDNSYIRLVTADLYRLTLTMNGNYLTEYKLQYNTSTTGGYIVDKFLFTYKYRHTIITDKKGVSILYGFNDEGKLLAKGEYTESLLDSDMLYSYKNEMVISSSQLKEINFDDVYLEYHENYLLRHFSSSGNYELGVHSLSSGSSDKVEYFFVPGTGGLLTKDAYYYFFLKIRIKDNIANPNIRSIDNTKMQIQVCEVSQDVNLETALLNPSSITILHTSSIQYSSHQEELIAFSHLPTFNGNTRGKIFVKVTIPHDCGYDVKDVMVIGDNGIFCSVLGKVYNWGISGYVRIPITEYDSEDYNYCIPLIYLDNNPKSLSSQDLLTNKTYYIKNNNTTFFFYNNLKNLLYDTNNITVYCGNPYDTQNWYQICSFTSFEFIIKETDTYYSKAYYKLFPYSGDRQYCIQSYSRIFLNYTGLSAPYLLNFDTCKEYDSNDLLIHENNGILSHLYTYNSSHDLLTHLISDNPLDFDTNLFKTSYNYTSLHRVSKQTIYYPSSTSVVNYYYSSNTSLLTQMKDNGVSTYYSYSPKLRYLYQVYSSLVNNNQLKQNTYLDDRQRIDYIKDASHSFYYGYDSLNRVNKVYFYNNNTMQNIVSFSYTDYANHNHRVTTTYPNNQSVHDKYNKYNKAIAICYASTSSNEVTFTYDSNNLEGKISTINEVGNICNILSTYSYDEQDRMSQYDIVYTSSNVTYNYEIHYEYDLLSRFTQVDVIDSGDNTYNLATRYHYENDNDKDDVTSIDNILNLDNQTMITSSKIKDNFDRLSHITHSYSLTDIHSDYIYEHDDTSPYLSNRIVSLSTYNFSIYPISPTHTISTYTYSNDSKITSIEVRNFMSTYSVSTSYEYDGFNRLIKETTGHDGIAYAYDNDGNITSVTTLYDNVQTGIINYSYSSTIPNLLISYGNKTLTYDNALNIISFDNATYSYIRGHLLSTYIQGNTSVSYEYNYKNIRTVKVVNNIKHLYILNDDKIVRELIIDTLTNTVTHSIIYLYSYLGVSGLIYDDDIFMYDKDILNNVIAIRKLSNNSRGEVVNRYEYDAYGNVKTLTPLGAKDNDPDSIGNNNPFRYRSYYYDSDTNMYYCNARYYVPTLRRWLTIDDTEYLDSTKLGCINLFAYCKNNPIMYSDESGNFALLSLLAGFGALLGIGAIKGIGAFVAQTIIDTLTGQGFDVWRSLIASASGFIGGLLMGTPLPEIISTGITSGLNGVFQTAYSNNGLNIGDCIGIFFISAIVGVASSFAFQKIESSLSITHLHKKIFEKCTKAFVNGKYIESFGLISHYFTYMFNGNMAGEIIKAIVDLPFSWVKDGLFSYNRKKRVVISSKLKIKNVYI